MRFPGISLLGSSVNRWTPLPCRVGAAFQLFRLGLKSPLEIFTYPKNPYRVIVASVAIRRRSGEGAERIGRE
jgi:hypothetical protein